EACDAMGSRLRPFEAHLGGLGGHRVSWVSSSRITGSVPVAGSAAGAGANQVPRFAPARASETLSALVTRAPIPWSCARRAAIAFVAAPPVPTLLTTLSPNS